MKIARVEIEGFRRFREPFVLDLTDELGRPRDLVALTGFNGSGKTSILDAIGLALQPGYQLPCLRPGLPISPRAIVSRGAKWSRVKVDLMFDETEQHAVTQAILAIGEGWRIPVGCDLSVVWTFPSIEYSWGRAEFEPRENRALLSGRKLATELISRRLGTLTTFNDLGGLFTFDQERPSLGMRIPENLKKFLYPTVSTADADREFADGVNAVLLGLALKSVIPGSRDQRFWEIQRRFGELFPDLSIAIEQTEQGDVELVFRQGESTFDYYGLSSGQKSVLYFLVQCVEKRFHRSVLLVDEPELHLEEPMQRKLLYVLQHLGENNQLILTTHSSYLAGVIPAESRISVGYDTVPETTGVGTDA